MNLATLAQPLLRLLPAEAAHRAAIAGLRLSPPHASPPADPRLRTTVAGLAFPNPLGLAAGFDKNAEVFGPALGLGFGFVEVGTLTPKPQPGNPKPRLFRLPEDAAVVNRYGFNNDGFAAALNRLRSRTVGMIGVNVGANKDSPDRVADYALGIRTFAKVADYFTVNVSSPNTPALRELQGRAALDGLLANVLAARDEAAPQKPVFLKIAPDLDEGGLDDILEVATARKVDALIIANTTVARPASLRSRHRAEMGGLSGRPLFEPSTRLLARAYRATGGALPLIGCGGVEDGKTALAKIEAGASLIQLYTSLALKGPSVVTAVLDGLARAVEAKGSAIGALVGAGAQEWI